MSAMSVTYHDLQDKVVVLTGGADGIGAATVQHFVLQGCSVAFLDIATEQANKIVHLITEVISKLPESRRQGLKPPIFYQCDIADLTAVERTIAQILERWPTVHILVNNAAMPGGKARIATENVSLADWDFNINANLRHVFFITKLLLPTMKKAGGGSIINIGSITWRIADGAVPIYGACKAAIMGLTRAHSKEFGPFNIRVNSVMPGAIATARQRAEVLTPAYRAHVMQNQSLQRDLEPEEVANIVVFLASGQASGVTGSSYVVDGGWVSDP